MLFHNPDWFVLLSREEQKSQIVLMNLVLTVSLIISLKINRIIILKSFMQFQVIDYVPYFK